MPEPAATAPTTGNVVGQLTATVFRDTPVDLTRVL